MSASPGAPQSAQTSFPGICWMSRRNRAALWLCDISLPDLRVSGGGGGDVRAAPPRSRRFKACSHLAVLRGQVRTGSSPQSGRRRNSDRVTSERLTSCFGAELPVAPGASRLSQERRANPAGGSENPGLSKLSFPHYCAGFVRAPALQTRTLTVVRSGSRNSCHICRGLQRWTGLKRGLMGPQQPQRVSASARQTSFSEGDHTAAL